jgi:hypothetical protein
MTAMIWVVTPYSTDGLLARIPLAVSASFSFPIAQWTGSLSDIPGSFVMIETCVEEGAACASRAAPTDAAAAESLRKVRRVDFAGIVGSLKQSEE